MGKTTGNKPSSSSNPASKSGSSAPKADAAAKQTTTTTNTQGATSTAKETAAKPVVKQIEEHKLNKIVEILMSEMEDVEKANISFLVIDEQERIQAFMRNRDVNYINMMNVSGAQPEKVRLAILGAMRYDKPLVFGKLNYSFYSRKHSLF